MQKGRLPRPSSLFTNIYERSLQKELCFSLHLYNIITIFKLQYYFLFFLKKLKNPFFFAFFVLNHPHLGNRSCLEVGDSDLIRNPISIRTAHLYQQQCNAYHYALICILIKIWFFPHFNFKHKASFVFYFIMNIQKPFSNQKFCFLKPRRPKTDCFRFGF